MSVGNYAMAFGGLGDLVEGNINPIKGLKKAFKGLNDESSAMGVSFTRISKKIDKARKDNEKLIKGFSAFGKLGGSIFSMGMDVMGVFMQLLDKMGVLKPIMDAIGLIFTLIGAEAMPILMESLEGLYEKILEMDWTEIGEMVGEFLSWMIEGIVNLLSNPAFFTMMKQFLAGVISFLKIFGGALVGFMGWISSLDIQGFKVAITALATFMAFMWGYGAAGGGPWGVAAGIAMGAIALAAVGGLMSSFAVGGIVTRPMIGQVGEAGPEAIIPLDDGKMPGSDELLWATEDNGKRLDRLTRVLEEQNTLMRMSYL